MVSVRKWAARAAVSVAAGVAISVGVTSGPATALVAPPPPTPTMILGAARAVAPGMASGMIACAASVVCAAGAGVVIAGTALYATRDTWIPWVQSIDWFGSMDKSVNLTRALWIGQPTVSGSVLTLGIYNQSTGSFVGGFDGLTICKTPTGAYLGVNFGKNEIWDNGAKKTQYFTAQCGTGNVPVWMKAGPLNSADGGRIQNERIWSADGESGALGKASTVRVTSRCLKADNSFQDVTMEYPASTIDKGLTAPSCAAAGVGVGAASSLWADVIMPGSAAARRIWSVAPEANGLYPECSPTDAAKLCLLEVWVDGSRCLVGDNRCVQWGAADPSRVTCRYGPYTVAVSWCNSLERAYRPGGAPATDANTDGDPNTYTKPDGSTGTDGLNPAEAPPAPSPIPTTQPPVVIDPSTGGETGAQNCYPTGSAAWNPVEWVMRPVQCAWVWATIPKQATVTQVKTQIGDALDSTGIPAIGAGVGDGFNSLQGQGGGGGCEGPPLTWPQTGKVYHLLSACDGVMATAASVTYALGVITVTVGGGFTLLRLLAAGFGYNVRLGGGGDDS